MKIVYIDPPEGWKYGFPKAIPEDKLKGISRISDWLVEEGYPKSVIDNYGAHFFYRTWQEERDEL